MDISQYLSFLDNVGLPDQAVPVIQYSLLLCLILFLALIIHFIVKRILLRLVLNFMSNRKIEWAGPLLESHFFERLSFFIPLTFCSLALAGIPDNQSSVYQILDKLLMFCFVFLAILTILSLLSAIKEIELILRKNKSSLLQGSIDALKIVTVIIGAIFIISIFTGKSPWGVLSIFGGLTAIILLIFKDTLLGFIASIQLSTMDMVRVGDWIEMSQYGADGDVISISIHTIRVQNWDKTITTIPTYSLVSSSFKNWRGMSESRGRRIKRSINIDISSISFCDERLLLELSKIAILKDYLHEKDIELAQHNSSLVGASYTSPLNGRKQTNIGIFRAYIIAYLKQNSNIHDDMTFLVRQLAPSQNGLPLEIYVFSKDQRWSQYEAIQADIFDHLLAAVSFFELRVYQAPSGYDLRSFRDSP